LFWSVFVVLVLAVLVASRWNLNYYALLPGTAQPVQQFITVPPDKGHPVTHPVLLTDVEIGRVTALTYLYYRLQGNSALEQVDAVTGGTPPSQLNAQGALEMSQAENDAKAAALTRLGYSVPATQAGAVIFGTYPGTPAYQALSVGDVVTAVNGVATPTAEALVTNLSRYHSGDTVRLTVRKGGTAPPAPIAITLKTTEVDVGGGQMVKLDLGIQPEDQVDFTYPFDVDIDVTNIGGPSAGLAMTLGVIDALTSGSVTGSRTVAATGTIDSQGDVGDVGGVAQKTVAVENAGASIFLVPPQEYKAAMSKDRPGLKVYAVSTLDQALDVLAAHGGTVPPAPPGTTVSPAATG
jgi:PDZ domain-containing protein